jgi:hypothetical protein
MSYVRDRNILQIKVGSRLPQKYNYIICMGMRPVVVAAGGL